jgi:heat shock protein HslJ
LTGTTWQWVNLTDPNGVTNVSDPQNYTILFNDDGTANITADCNQVQATYTVDESSINITLGPSTRAACGPESLDQVYLNSLENAAIYFFEGGELFMDLPLDGGTTRFSVSGAAVAPPVEEEEESGVLQFILASYGPAGSEQPVLAGTTITANFGDTQVSGTAGCNDYTAPLTPVDDYFTVGPIAVTAMECSEPAGVMEQEAAYLDALAATSGYLWQQDENTLVTAGEVFYILEDGTSGVLNFVSP